MKKQDDKQKLRLKYKQLMGKTDETDETEIAKLATTSV
jgi:hypothetical protein